MRRILASLLAATLCGGAQAGMEVKWKRPKDSYLGTALFDLYQDRNFTGIIKLAAAHDMNQVKLQHDDSELALAMLNLSYGLHRETAAVMIDLANKGTLNNDIRNHIWFYIAKIRYQRGYFTQAESALSSITGALPLELEQDLQSFMALLLMDRLQYGPAIDVLKQLRGRTTAVPFGRFNTGVSLLLEKEEAEKRQKVGKKIDIDLAAKEEEALKFLRAVASFPGRNTEEKSLHDRANVHLGYISLIEKKDSKAAIEHFEQVRLHGSEANDALLGLGWAHYNLEEYDRALVAWMELAKRNVADQNVQEARVAVPYTLAKLGAMEDAAAKYTFALDSFKQELKSLDTTINLVRKGAYFDKLLTSVEDGVKGWRGDVYSLPKSTESYYFTQMLARHDYQEALKNYRDLRYLLEQLDVWERNLDAYEDTSRYWQGNLQSNLARFDDTSFNQRVKELRDTRDRYAVELMDIELTAEAMKLATPKELEQLNRIRRLKAAVELDAGKSSRETQLNRIDLIERRVLWEIHSNYPSRLRKLKQSIEETDQAITQAVSKKNNLKDTAKKASYAAGKFQARFDTSRAKIKALRPKIDAAVKESEQHLISIALKDLEKRKELLSNFIAQVSFSVGAVFDSGK